MTILTSIPNGASNKDIRDTINALLRTATTSTPAKQQSPGVFNPMDPAFAGGAKGDGTTDDTAPLDAWAAAINVAGGTAFVPMGYSFKTLTNRIRFTHSNTYLDGGGELLFATTSVDTWLGRVLFDGGYSSGEISNVGVRGQGVIIREQTRQDYSYTVMNDPLGNHPYSSMVCSLALRGCANVTVDGGTYLNAPGWSIHLLRCRNYKVVNTDIRDAIADGIHVDYGCTDGLIAWNTGDNLGDDFIAVGYTGAACARLLITGNKATNVGGKMLAVYGGESGKTDDIVAIDNMVDGTFASAIGVVAAKYGGSPGVPVAAASIGTVRLTGNNIRRAGMRTTSGYSRAVGASYGVNISPSGGTIDAVVLERGSIRDNRNSFVRIDDGTLGSFVMRGVDMGTMVATGGSGAASDGGGNNTAPPDRASVAVVLGTAAKYVVTGNTAAGDAYPDTASAPGTGSQPPPAGYTSDFAKADAAPSATALGSDWVVATGGDPSGMGISGGKVYPKVGASYPIMVHNFGSANADMVIENVTFGSVPVYFVLSSNLSTSDGVVFATSGTVYGSVAGSGNGNIQGFTALPAGTYASLRLKRSGLTVTVYNGTTVLTTLTLSAGFSANTYIGFGVYGTATGNERFGKVTVTASV